MSFLNDLTTADYVLAICVSSFAYTVLLFIYRIWLSPVAHIPGSPWPKITFSYEFYHEWMKPGQYYRKIHEMHEKYGKNHVLTIQCL